MCVCVRARVCVCVCVCVRACVFCGAAQVVQQQRAALGNVMASASQAGADVIRDASRQARSQVAEALASHQRAVDKYLAVARTCALRGSKVHTAIVVSHQVFNRDTRRDVGFKADASGFEADVSGRTTTNAIAE